MLPADSFYPSELKDHRKPRCKECHKAYKNSIRRKREDGVILKDGRYVVCNKQSTSILWTGNMISDLKRYYATTKNKDLADLLGVSMRTINRKAKELGLEKDRAWLIEVAYDNGIYGKVLKNKKLRELNGKD